MEMQLERESPALTPSPSFIGSSAAEERERPEVEEDEFEFAFVVGNPELGSDFNVADEIFSNGQIRPVYPFFNRDLLLAAGGEADSDAEVEKDDGKDIRSLLIEDREACSRSGSFSSTSSSADDLEGMSPGSYCVWNPRSVPPSPDRRKKSSSTGSGSASRKWRIRDLVVGRRSHSDGKEKFMFLAPPEKEKRPNPSPSPAAAKELKGKGKGKGARVTEVDMVTANRMYYAKGGDGGGGARRSFLPYKIGFFNNMSGLSRTQGPF